MAPRGAPPLAALPEAARAAMVEIGELREAAARCGASGAPLVLEIGFGGGERLLEQAAALPEGRFLGVERSRKRVLKAARRVARAGLANVRLVCAPAEAVLADALAPGSVAGCWICCPDPWPKRRHQRRRLFQPGLVAALARALAPGAMLHASTDDEAYARWIDLCLRGAPELENAHAPLPWSDAAPARPATAYEREWIAGGRRIVYFDYRKRA